jgi:cAMP-specific phosphodiesterase 4
VAESLQFFFEKYSPNYKPLYFESGNWSVAFVNANDYPHRHWSLTADREFSVRGGGLHESISTILAVDISDRNAHDAVVEVIIMFVIIVQIALFSVALHMLLYQSIVKPLRRIYEAIKSHASVVVRSLDKAADIQYQGISSNEMDPRDADMTAMEVAINKILKFVSTSVDLGGRNEVLHQLTSGADAETLAWISNMTGVRAIVDKEHADIEIQKSTEPTEEFFCYTSSLPPGARVGRDSTLTGPQQDTNKIQSWSFNLFEYVQSMCSNAINNDSRDTKDDSDDKINIYSKLQEVLQELIVTMFEQLNLIDSPGSNRQSMDCKSVTSEKALRNFLAIICKSYSNKNPYHNIYHCVDVSHATFLMINMLKDSNAGLSHLECFALMVAAVAHDVDHPGVSNSYLVSSHHPLALTYNDISVLENKHASTLYAIVNSDKEADIFENLDHDSWIQVRKLIIDAIIHTDMTKHFPMMSRLEMMIQLRAANDDQIETSCFGQSQEDRLLLLSMILHAADISNPVRPITVASRWADMVTQEFFAQGDLEKSKGYPVSPMCDRQGTLLPETQVKFIEFIVAPYYNLIERIFPEFSCLTQRIDQNKQHWKSRCSGF